MFARIKNYITTHKQKIIIGGALVSGAILLSKHVQKLLREWEEKETKELFERARKQQHYESVERTCNQTALTMAPKLWEIIFKLFKTEELISNLKTGAPNKIGIWGELKILAFAKLSALVYATSLLIVTLRIQLNLIGGYMFYDSTSESGDIKITSAIQEKYFGLCQFFMDDGAMKLCKFIEEKVKLVLQDIPLEKKLKIHDVEEIFWAIQTSISIDSRDPCKSFATYILPDSLQATGYGSNFPIFHNIIVETNDLLECDEITKLISSCISAGFSYVTDEIAEFFKKKTYGDQCNKIESSSNQLSSTPEMNSATSSNNIDNLNNVAIPMAKLIPIVNGLMQSPSNKNDVPSTWIQQLIFMDSIKAMGANIYETFSSKG
ncbi:hypothetical protein RUM44_012957 [Polyplax serrata]|uniref:Peroxisomal biogenesis factor 3 n=1 Tax=Polyplax serrata TaxID=468196 RepID=A0ABR1BCT0_POLSC